MDEKKQMKRRSVSALQRAGQRCGDWFVVSVDGRQQLERQFRDEIDRHQQALATPGTGSFVSELVRGQTELRIAEVEAELLNLRITEVEVRRP